MKNNKKTPLSDEALYQQMLKELEPGVQEYDRMLSLRRSALRHRRWTVIVRYAACLVCVLCCTWAAWHIASRTAKEETSLAASSRIQKAKIAMTERQKASATASEALSQQPPQLSSLPRPAHAVAPKALLKEPEAEPTAEPQPLDVAVRTDSISSNEKQLIEKQIENTLFELQLIETVINYALTYQDIDTL